MTISVINEKENPLFRRKEVTLAFESKITPSKKEATELIANHFKVKAEVIKLRKVEGRFGSNVFKIIGEIYNTKKDYDAIVKKTKQEVLAEKKALEEKKKAEAEAAEAVAAEKVGVEESVEGESK